MRLRLQPTRVFLIFAAGAVMAVTACSSSSSSSSSSAKPSASASPTAASTSDAVAQIKANWEAFFNPKTPVATRVSLLQNGQDFESIIKAQAGSPLAASATSSVSSVTVESPAQAKVVYSILVGGSPALKNQPGVAVYQSGIWKVGDQSFCALLTLENSGKAPAACPSAAG
jgi:hypothetical protein